MQKRLADAIATALTLFSLVSIAAPCVASPVERQFRDIKMAPDRDQQSEAGGAMRADAQEVAALLDIAPMVERLRALQKLPRTDATHRTRAVQNMRLLCMWRIFIAEEELRKVIAQIDFNLSETYTELAAMEAKKMSLINDVNSVNFMQSGILGIIKDSISFPGRYNNPHVAQELGIVAFSNQLALTSVNLVVVPMLVSRRVGGKPNMLAHIFNPNYKPADYEHNYLWKFFNSPIPGNANGLTRREILIRHWQDFEGVQIKDQKNLDKLGHMYPEGQSVREQIRMVNQRIDLLQDMKSHIEEFDASLFELHKSITLD
ncbi:MAG: hypothetical protein U0105_18265 [Candidatus Obscuribacterales bacterium]|jgi:hypothetical protein